MNNIEAREKVLDLGIGRGHDYVLNDRDKILRVGADIHFDDLKATRRFHLENQSLLDAKDNFPFSAESFDRIQIFYPDCSLLESVCNQETSKRVRPLWSELGRILRTGGTVELFVDEYKRMPFSTAVYDDSGKKRYIWRPHVKAERVAIKYGFDVKVERLSEEKLESLENSSSLTFTIYANQYLISAIKSAEVFPKRTN